MAEATRTQIRECSDEIVDEMCLNYLDGMSLTKMQPWLLKTHGIKYSRQTLSIYFKSPEGADRLDRIREHLAHQYMNQVLANKSSRVNALVVEALRLRDKIRSFTQAEVGSPDYSKVLTPYTSVLKQIQSEMEPFKIETTTKSPFEQFTEILNGREDQAVQARDIQ
jgi:hypothetical protein